LPRKSQLERIPEAVYRIAEQKSVQKQDSLGGTIGVLTGLVKVGSFESFNRDPSLIAMIPPCVINNDSIEINNT